MTVPNTGDAPEQHGVAVVTIDHGERNLLNPEVMAELRQGLLDADRDAAVTGILLTGAGASFCGGLDVGAIQAGADPREFATALVELLEIFPRLTTPVAAYVNGDAVASGAALVAACDYAAAVDGVQVGTYEVSVGVWPMVAQVPLIARIGPRAAMESIGAGRPFSTQRAYEVGLVQHIGTAAEAREAALGWLADAARAGAVMVNRPSVYELADLPYQQALERSLEMFAAQFEER